MYYTCYYSCVLIATNYCASRITCTFDKSYDNIINVFLTFCFAVMEDLRFTHSRHVVTASGLYLEWNTTSYEGVNFCLIL